MWSDEEIIGGKLIETGRDESNTGQGMVSGKGCSFPSDHPIRKRVITAVTRLF